MFYSRYLKEEKRSKPSTGKNRPPPSPRTAAQPRRLPGINYSTGRWGGLGRSRKGANSFDPLQYKHGKKTVHFSTIEVQHFHFDWSQVADCFYSRKELTAMGSQRFDDAALLRRERHLDLVAPSNGATASQDDLDINIKNKPQSISALLTAALQDEDANPDVSIRGIEHFVYPELQQEMIRKKKEVQAQVVSFVRSKRPDPQGWRLANHSRMYSQWARDVALEKGRAYRMHDADDGGATVTSPVHSPQSPRLLTSSASFSAASYCEAVETNDVKKTILLERRDSDVSAAAATTTTTSPKSLLKKTTTTGGGTTVDTTVHQFQELRVNKEVDDISNGLKMAMSDEYQGVTNDGVVQSAGADTDEA